MMVSLIVILGIVFSVVQQPQGQYGWVSSDARLTQFSLPKATTAILAHNYLSGHYFYQLKPGEAFYVVSGGSTAQYVVEHVEIYALNGSKYFNMDTGREYTESQLYYKIFGSTNGMVLQTCIHGGRYFVIAKRVEYDPHPLNVRPPAYQAAVWQ